MNKRVRYFRFIRSALVLSFCAGLSAATLITACGRRGDPVPLVPPDVSSENTGPAKEGVIGEVPVGSAGEAEEAVPEAAGTVLPDPPGGLIAVFSQPVVILSWDEVTEQGIRFYRVYRASEDVYSVVGRTISTAFTDTNVKPGVKYRYRVSAVGQGEGLTSQEVTIETPGEWD